MAWAEKLVPGSRIAGSAEIHPSVRLGDGLTIGRNVVIYPGSDIRDGATIYDGTVIGRPPHRPLTDDGALV